MFSNVKVLSLFLLLFLSSGVVYAQGGPIGWARLYQLRQQSKEQPIVPLLPPGYVRDCDGNIWLPGKSGYLRPDGTLVIVRHITYGDGTREVREDVYPPNSYEAAKEKMKLYGRPNERRIPGKSPREETALEKRARIKNDDRLRKAAEEEERNKRLPLY